MTNNTFSGSALVAVGSIALRVKPSEFENRKTAQKTTLNDSLRGEGEVIGGTMVHELLRWVTISGWTVKSTVGKPPSFHQMITGRT